MDSAARKATSGFDAGVIVNDYKLCVQSRQASLIARKEVLTGKAKFGITGDGKEVPQVAMAHAWSHGDIRSGYYREQTLMFALNLFTVKQFFAQLYAHAELEAEPATGGRQMNSHFATRMLNPDGSWKDLTLDYHTAADLSPTASQIPKVVGLSYASKLYRKLPDLKSYKTFSKNGDEITWGMIGNASCAEGMFWETVNAIGVLQTPAIISIWDDGYGISVPNIYQITKEPLDEMLSGFRRTKKERGFEIFSVAGWDYPALVKVYKTAAELARKEHVPSLVYAYDLTQPQGHSTSGSHERYKSKERLEWERRFDCNLKMRNWMIETGVAKAKQLDELEEKWIEEVKDIQQEAWSEYQAPIVGERREVEKLIKEIAESSANRDYLLKINQELHAWPIALRKDIYIALSRALIATRGEESATRDSLQQWKVDQDKKNKERYCSCMMSTSSDSSLNVPEVPIRFDDDSKEVRGFEVLNACFDAMLKRDPRVIAFGEDVGYLGDVNQAFAGLQAKYGELRVTDTGIREVTIVGQAIGMAMRGLRPIAEIQYLDYLLYCLQLMSDDLATLLYRTRCGQKAPVIIRTRGHRLEGIWHSGSPMAGIINLVRGMNVLVPRDMTQAAGFYNTMLLADDPCIIIEVLNGYRLKEKLPANIGEFTLPVGVPEIIREGEDLTIVTYGACCRIALEASELLKKVGVSAEVIDVQSLLPFDRYHRIVESLKKTNRVLFLDEDVPGGATAFMMQQVLEVQGGYNWLDAEPRTLSGKPHRPAYGTDGNYWSKPEAEHIFEAAYGIMHEIDPRTYAPIFTPVSQET
ncbi:MAG: transketolase [Deltaproteobacteria bacterium RIFCSPHIGHO2_12_FULL_43_9]|nr:MAG: transketolase [Deltaproteobacteria bacterium RIFCSPHIGHO2_12_FULL_43_9]